jgi:hypothetical protein
MAAQNTQTVQAELELPGAEADPCCMGSEAQSMLEVLEGFAQEELVDAATFRQLCRCARCRADAAVLRELGQAADCRAREINAACFLITGVQKRLCTAAVVLPRLPWRALLRERYHGAACNGLNYARAADAAADPCLQKMLSRFSGECYDGAERILRLLAQKC